MANQFMMSNLTGVLESTKGILKSKVAVVRNPVYISTLSRDGVLISHCKKLGKCLGALNYLDEVVLRKFLEENDVEKWKEVLDDVGGVISVPAFRDAAHISELLCLVDNALKACVEGKLMRHMEATLVWFDLTNKVCGLSPDEMRFKRNHQAIVRASLKNDLASVDTLFRHNFRASSRLAYDFFGKATETRNDILLELNYLEAMTTAAYLFAEAKNKEGVDPVNRAFNHLQTCQELSKSMKAYSNKLDNIGGGLKRFTWQMLDLCNGKEQVELFLAQDDDIDCLSINDSSIMPRIYQAWQLDHKEFVTHDNCQQVLRKVFYDQQYDKFKESSLVRKLWHGTMQVVLIPVYVAMHLLAKFTLPCCKSNKVQQQQSSKDQEIAESGSSRETEQYFFEIWFNDSKVPFNRLIMQIACYVLFLAWILLTLLNPDDTPNKVDLNPFDILSGIWALGYIMADINLMYQISESVNMRDGSPLDMCFARVSKFFSNNFFTYRMLSHVIYFCGIVTESLGYFLEPVSRDIVDLGCATDDPRSYSGFSLVKSGICLQGIGVVMIFTHIFQVLRLHLTIGSLYVAIRMCISIVLSFILTYGIITIAFAIGLHFILRHSNEICDESGNPVTLSCNDSFIMQRRHVGVYCLTAGNNSRIHCPDECWKKFTEDPEAKDHWKETCRSNETAEFLQPKINVNEQKTWGGEKSEDLGKEKNRFISFYSSIKTLFWTVFDPGHPEVVGCSEGSSRYAALFLWIVYNTIVVIILLNLLIALMNVAMNDVVENRVASWKYHRTQVWMDFCNRNVVLPSPFNLLSLLADILRYLVCKPCQACSLIPPEDDTDHLFEETKRLKYRELSRMLITKYLNDLEAFEEVDAINVGQLGRELKKLMKGNHENMRKDMKKLKAILDDIEEDVGEIKKKK